MCIKRVLMCALRCGGYFTSKASVDLDITVILIGLICQLIHKLRILKIFFNSIRCVFKWTFMCGGYLSYKASVDWDIATN